MFGIAWAEMLVILAAALVLIGPKDLPRVLYGAGKILRNVRRFTGDIQKSIDDIMREEELNDIIRDANRPGGDNLQFEIDRQFQIEQARKTGAQAGGPDLTPAAKAFPLDENAPPEQSLETGENKADKKPGEKDASG